MSNTTEQRLDEIEKMFELGETAKACNMIEALLNETRTKGYSDGFQMGQFERDMDNIYGTEELTPKDNK